MLGEEPSCYRAPPPRKKGAIAGQHGVTLTILPNSCRNTIDSYIDIFSALFLFFFFFFFFFFPQGGTQKGRLRKSTKNVNISKYMTESTYF